MLKKIISGGQTGVDRAALDASRSLGLELGGWCPAGRRAEDGPIDRSYPLKETEDADYATRTRKNVVDSDGTLIVSPGPLSGGTKLTRELAEGYGRPF
ncbi:MAG: putative molybdenum carrier protein, partial [Rhodothermales bacterium]